MYGSPLINIACLSISILYESHFFAKTLFAKTVQFYKNQAAVAPNQFKKTLHEWHLELIISLISSSVCSK